MARFAGIIGGAVLIAAGALIPGAQGLIVPGIALTASGVISLAFAPKTDNQQSARSADLVIATAAEGVPVPIIFGEQRVTGNFMNYSADQMRVVELRQKTGGKGDSGESSQVVGYEYYLPWEQGICMGEIDFVRQVISSPGESKMLDENPVITTTAQLTATTASYTQPNVGSNVTITFGSTALLIATDQIIVANAGRYTVMSITNGTDAVCRLEEKLASGYYAGFVGTITSGRAVTLIQPPAVATVRRLAFGDTGDFIVGKTLTIVAHGEWLIQTIHSGTQATCRLDKILAAGELPVGTNVTIPTDTRQEFGANEYLELSLANEKEGGLVRLYCGSPWQTRISSGDVYASTGMNYRHLCWALFMNFKMGSNPQPKTYQFIIGRFPRCVRDDGTTIAGVKTRGSDDSGHPAYWQANLAACVYEMAVEKLWAAGISSDVFDEDSLIAASQVYATMNFGVSFTVDTQEQLARVIDGLREQGKLLLLPSGDKIKFRCLLDTATVHSSIVTLTKNEIWDVRFSRPTWRGTRNEVRLEFTSRERDYKPDSEPVHALGNIQIQGRLRSTRIAMPAITEREQARKQALRKLKEVSYPFGQIAFKMNRSKSHVQPGDIVRIFYDEWSSGVVTGYYQITRIKPGGSKREELEVEAIEDFDLNAIEGEETTVTSPTVASWQRVTTPSEEQTRLFVPDIGNTLPIVPAAVFEVPAIITQGKENRIMVTGQKPATALNGIAAYGAQYGVEPKYLGTTTSFAVTGTLLTALPTGLIVDRSAAGFQFSLTNTADEAAILGSANKVALDADDVNTLLNQQTDYMVIGDELLQIGLVEKLGTNQFRARNFVRGVLGTRQSAHVVGQQCFYSPVLLDGIKVEDFDEDIETRFRAYPVSSKGVANIGSDLFINHAAPNDRLFLGIGKRPIAPQPYSIAVVGLDSTLKMRPQFYDRGAGIWNFEKACATLVTNIGNMKFLVEARDSGGTVLQGKTLQTHTFTPDSLTDATAGMVTIAYTMPGSTAKIRVYSELDGEVSVEYAEFTV